MNSGLINHLWQSTVFAMAAGVLTLAFRKNRAQVRYWLWLAASVKFLVPFALLMSLGSLAPRPAVVESIAPPAVAVAIVQFAEPLPEPSSPVAPRPQVPWVAIAWACGFAGIALIRLRGWAQVRAAVRASTPVQIPATVEVRSAPGLLEPGVVGVFRPTLLLPDGIAKLTPAQFDAVLAHEMCHVRRRDNLTSAIHMLVEAVFWFHPLVWWIGARLVEERERACDEEVLRLGGDARDYADAILNVCKLYVESPLACVAGVTGADLKKRIEAIMMNRLLPGLTLGKKAALAAACVMALAAPIAVGVLRAQTAPAPTPKWEVTAVRRCEDAPAGTRGGASNSSPGRLSITCQSLRGLILQAYALFASGQANLSVAASNTPIEGGPGWINTERYEIDAKAESDASVGMMRGPMLQKLLEARFKLRLRRETREIPVYDLVVAKGGLKLPRSEIQSCPAERRLSCFDVLSDGRCMEIRNMSIEQFSKSVLAIFVDRPVIDKTGLTGLFDFRFQFTPDDTAENPEGLPSIYTAVQEQLGLKLEPARGPGEFLVIDHVERPSEN
jgi:bla regulator protein blaR1